IDSSSEGAIEEENLLESILAALICKIEVTSGRAFLEANTSLESCLRLLKMWNRLRPSTQKILTLAAEVKTLKKDKEHLRINLSKAEEEVKILFEENNILDEANKRLVRQSREEKNLHDSGRKHTGSASAKVTSSEEEEGSSTEEDDEEDPKTQSTPLIQKSRPTRKPDSESESDTAVPIIKPIAIATKPVKGILSAKKCRSSKPLASLVRASSSKRAGEFAKEVKL
ncbi:hypothetical protein Golob_010914, partial [Gossypium lobatum]|nr:hypothetical protein [Gossypium lobatum]